MVIFSVATSLSLLSLLIYLFSLHALKLWPCKVTLNSFHVKYVTFRFSVGNETLLRLFWFSGQGNASCVL